MTLPTIRLALRLLLGFFVLSSCLALDVGAAYAQSASCSRLNASLRTLDRNRDFRNYEERSQDVRALAARLQDAESAYIRTGCNDLARAGQPLTRECRTLAREITRGRADYADLSASLDTGSAIAQQREALLQEISRFGCNTGNSRVDIREEQARRGNLFEQMFGGFTRDGQFVDGDIVGDEFSGYGGYNTVRTLCVRLSDGYFWPVSYSTLPDYISYDAGQCVQQCPGAEVALYHYSNPGQEVEQMVNLYGEPYSALPNAFRYLKEFDTASTCRPQADSGVITVADNGQGGQSRAVIDFEGASFPMPLRDPRSRATVAVAELDTATVAEQYVTVPLPRPRPAAPGEAPRRVAMPAQHDKDQPRVVRFGDKTVRIVGPDTPYARLGEAGI